MLNGWPMKVDPKATMTVAAAKQPFKQLLAEAKAELKKDQPTLATPLKVTPAKPGPASQQVKTISLPGALIATASSAPVARALQHARVSVDGEAQRLGAVRSGHAKTAEGLQQARAHHVEANLEKGEARVIELIVRELTGGDEARPQAKPLEPATVHHLQPLTAAPPKPDTTPNETKAAQAVALIEKIETFVRSQRPGLALTLNNSLGAHVEIERIGPKEIALKLVGHRGPPTAEAVSRIREELRARGLKVGALSVA